MPETPRTPDGSDDERRTGPEPERRKIGRDWEHAVRDALKKKPTAEGWPKPPAKKRKSQHQAEGE